MRALLFILLSAFSAASVAEIYKWVDKDGSVVYSDTPQKNAEKVDLPPPSTYSPPPLPKFQPTPPAGSAEFSYQSFAITKPAPDETFWNQPTVEVVLALEPALAVGKGHTVIATVDGTNVASTTAMQLTLSNLERGAHSVSVRVIDNQGKELISAGPVTFHVKQHSVLSPTGQPKPTPQKPK